MTHDIEDIAERVANKAVKTILLQIGIDVENPLDAQRDFHYMREAGKLASDHEFKKDIEHIRIWRTRTQSITSKSIALVITMFITGLLTSAWLGIQQLFHK